MSDKNNKEPYELETKEEIESVLYFLYELESLHIDSLIGLDNPLNLSDHKAVGELIKISKDILLAKESLKRLNKKNE
jgi:hypothetical protein